MSLSNRLQRFLEDGGGQPYECGNCGRQFELNRQACPGCGSYLVARRQYDDLLAHE